MEIRLQSKSIDWFLYEGNTDILWVKTNDSLWASSYPASIYLFKVNNGNTRTMCEICTKLTIKTPERR